MINGSTDAATGESRTATARKQYQTPQLAVLGSVRDLTCGGSGSLDDGNFSTRQGGQPL